jgi:glycosyltransferase involved in cell wall biosynthesis
MRFLMLSWRDPSNPLSGGAERVTLAYLAALKERGHEVFWYANDFPGGAAAEVIQGVQIVRGGGYGTSVLKAIRWYRRQKPFDLVMDQHHGIPWLAPWWAKTNCVSYLHEVLGPIWSSFYPWPVSAIGRFQERVVHWLYRNTRFWVGSQSTQKALHARGVKDVTVIHYGIEQVPIETLEPKPLESPLRLICVSRLAPNKRIDHAVRALRVLLDRGLPASLMIVGGGELEQTLKNLANELKVQSQVTFAGRLSEADKDAQLRRAHLLIHTSVREGWGLNVLEANAMGTPAAVYPVPGLVDATIHDQTGIVTAAETPESVADGIQALLKKPERYEVYRVNARERTKEFHWSRVLPRACDWLEQQAAGSATKKS